MKKVLVTGGMGYIGSHTVVALQQAGYDVVIADNLSNSNEMVLDRIETITRQRPTFYFIELCNLQAVTDMFNKEKEFDVIIHFAAFKSVGESVTEPLKYFVNNLTSLLNIVDCMMRFKTGNLVFSSSATVYGDPDELPIKENSPFKKALSAYGSTKQMGEDILEKIAATGNIQVISLRYFNPVGAHTTALIGEQPSGKPNNLMPYITQTAIGKLQELTVFGTDYETRDGSGIRDYIHVVDLANAHVKSCSRLITGETKASYEVFNIGTGNGISVKELIDCFEKENNIKLNYRFGDRRPGDAAEVYANVEKANSELGWKAEKTITDMVKDAWRWEQRLHAEQKIISIN